MYDAHQSNRSGDIETNRQRVTAFSWRTGYGMRGQEDVEEKM